MDSGGHSESSESESNSNSDLHSESSESEINSDSDRHIDSDRHSGSNMLDTVIVTVSDRHSDRHCIL